MNVSLACTTEFLSAQAKLPKHVQRKVRRFLDGYRANPTSSGYNFEQIVGSTSENLRSVRIDRTYRAIVYQVKKGNNLICLWVDHHDNAYQWAQTHKCAVHPDTAAIQIYPIETSTEVLVKEGHPTRAGGLFGQWRDRELRRLSVPEELIPLVRKLESEADLDRHDDVLPTDAYIALSDLAQGKPYEDLVRDLQASKPGIGGDDFDEALKESKNRQDFIVIDDDESLKAMLDAPLGEWRIYLHPMQRRLVEMKARGPIRVMGGAGTGKTVVAMHRAKRLVSEVFTQPNDRVLFLMFSTNLAADIRMNLKRMCAPQDFARIEVNNIDAWVAQELARIGERQRIVYDPEIIRNIWKEAVDSQDEELPFSRTFIKEEFRDVILANGIESEDEYLAVARRGREKAVQQSDRRKLWQAFEAYRDLLTARGLWEKDDAMRELRRYMTPEASRYRSVIVDEAQDLSAECMRLIRALVPPGDNDLLIVGDAHQRIFGHPIVLSHCGIHIRGRSRRLKINYRTPEEVRACAVGVLEGVSFHELDGSLASVEGYRSLIRGAKPVIRGFESITAECDFVEQYIKELEVGDDLHQICIVAPTNDMAKNYSGVMEYKGIKVFPIRTNREDNLSSPGVRIGTMHRVKGLEFDHMIAVGVNDGTLPNSRLLRGASNAAAKEEIMRKARSLMYVVCSRSRKTLCLTSHGNPSPLLATLAESL